MIMALPFLHACNPNNTNMNDRIEIQDLVNNYAYYADGRDAQKQANLFTTNAVLNIFMGKISKPDRVRNGRKELQSAFETLRQYEYTTHFNGQSTITSLNGNSATGIAYCLAHHIKTEDGETTLLIMSIRYHDNYVKQDGKWYFAKRDLIVDWTDLRKIHTSI